MSKKKSSTKSTTPNAPNAPARESFLPTKDAPPAPTVTETPSLASLASDDPITLKTEHIDDRNVRVTLTVPPLAPCIENIFMPQPATPEQIASWVSGAIKRAAQSAQDDGIYQHARKANEEAESRQRARNAS